jgi:hypothetical protein
MRGFCLPTLQPGVRIIDFDAAVALDEFALLDGPERFERVERMFPARGTMLECQEVVPKRHFRQREVEGSMDLVALGSVGDGVGGGGYVPAADIDRPRVGGFKQVVLGQSHGCRHEGIRVRRPSRRRGACGNGAGRRGG